MTALGYSFAYTCAVLTAWGRWSLDRLAGYPTHSAHVVAVHGRSGAPEGVIAVDAAIALLGRAPDERHLQRRIIVHYQRDCGVRELLRRLALGARQYYEQLEEAQWAVHVRLI